MSTRTKKRTEKPTSKKKNETSVSSSDSNDKITIRMYRIGFGDCFLITLPTSSGPRYVLIDCGVHSRGNIQVGGTSLLEKAVQNISEITGQKLAILIATHAHQDHIFGFGKFASRFGEFSIGEVWLPWTEDPNNAQAQKWRKKKMALVQQLVSHFAALGASDSPAAAAAANMSVDQQALSALHSGFGVGAKVRYLQAGDSLQAPADLSGLSVQILGPPQDEQFLSQMDPPAGQRYLRLDGNQTVEENVIRPFLQKWRVAPGEMLQDWPMLAPADLEEMDRRANMPLDGLAFSLDQAVNNTSVVALFTYQGQHLLFPGDAQYGNWRFWLEQQTAPELLSELCFYKVSHHGSVNATPKDALERMPDGKFAAMISTQNTPWPSIPRSPLVDAIDRKTGHKFVRSDSLFVPGAPQGPQIRDLPAGFKQGDFWYDYVLS